MASGTATMATPGNSISHRRKLKKHTEVDSGLTCTTQLLLVVEAAVSAAGNVAAVTLLFSSV